MHIPLLIPPLIHCDNISAISLASNPVFHSRMKHLQIDYHFVKERVFKGDLFVQHVSSTDQFADILNGTCIRLRGNVKISMIKIMPHVK